MTYIYLIIFPIIFRLFFPHRTSISKIISSGVVVLAVIALIVEMVVEYSSYNLLYSALLIIGIPYAAIAKNELVRELSKTKDPHYVAGCNDILPATIGMVVALMNFIVCIIVRSAW